MRHSLGPFLGCSRGPAHAYRAYSQLRHTIASVGRLGRFLKHERRLITKESGGRGASPVVREDFDTSTSPALDAIGTSSGLETCRSRRLCSGGMSNLISWSQVHIEVAIDGFMVLPCPYNNLRPTRVSGAVRLLSAATCHPPTWRPGFSR